DPSLEQDSEFPARLALVVDVRAREVADDPDVLHQVIEVFRGERTRDRVRAQHPENVRIHRLRSIRSRPMGPWPGGTRVLAGCPGSPHLRACRRRRRRGARPNVTEIYGSASERPVGGPAVVRRWNGPCILPRAGEISRTSSPRHSPRRIPWPVTTWISTGTTATSSGVSEGAGTGSVAPRASARTAGRASVRTSVASTGSAVATGASIGAGSWRGAMGASIG